MDKNSPYSIKQSIIFAHKVAQLSKALWKSIEKDWQNWIKPFDLNINEHHILLIAYQLEGASISDVAKFGVMHVSTAFNFSKKLEERGLLTFSKKQNDKRNTYICLTDEGEKLLLDTLEVFDPREYGIYEGALPIKELYGKFPEFSEVMTIVRHIYGPDFMVIFEKTLEKMEQDFSEENGCLISTSNVKAETS
ncbi:transcriptional regulator [Anaerobacillus alkalilacustris]|uniref:Transcriptional regulator n=1 Tax=Anaerobacillus alkalilacustris TaxID=393763 RepID=A0A1S2LWJ7_9BACI|nr:HTH-type transcriptional regulator Hpr [Anaerobacillus alkalilacustris]OIJ16550.1 transcriptional regulator [Anaerobacillus alkalilacustris]